MPTARDPLALRLLVSILVSGHSGLVLPFVGVARPRDKGKVSRASIGTIGRALCR